ncbi:V-type proton ATPase subunit S1 isoform X3 [Pantherophis guttatus]|uniref:V-type proton ATPase subunit S1 isoform X3 n=1 Tax=Pantherophis guttatus TaxID=94885 RepID=A0A6P9E1B9_PANGU|nr:V-type proton ATPase subunit S1 isoform X3 [Pantherophis guttatus]
MESSVIFRFLFLLFCVRFSSSMDQIPGRMERSLFVFSDQDLLQRNGRRYDGSVKPKINLQQVAITQIGNYSVSTEENLEKESMIHSHYSPLNVTINGSPCILFWARRIMIKLQNHTQLDLTDKTFGVHASVDVADSNCSEENAMLSLNFGDIDNLKGFVIRFILTNSYYKLSIQNWFTLHRIQLIYNQSVQATFNATRIHAPAIYSYHCEHVSNLQRYDALLTPSSANDAAKHWEVTFIDFQMKDIDTADEKEPLRINGHETYELRSQQYSKIYI